MISSLSHSAGPVAAWGLAPSLIDVVFPFHLVLDGELTIVQVGSSLRRIAPQVAPGCRLDDVLRVTSPRGPRTFAAFAKAARSLFLLEAPGGSLTLRGQMLHDEEAGVVVFVGSPWITQLGAIGDQGLSLGDFAVAVADSVVDYLLLLQTQAHALEQAKVLSSQLEDVASELSYQAHHDPLTRLPNRGRFAELLDAALNADGGLRRHAVGVLLMDLDGFKDVNDSLGHDVGDLVLQEVARRLRSALRVNDEVARLGGDEFVVLLPAIADVADAVVIAKRIGAELAAPFSVNGVMIRLAGSIGIATSPIGPVDRKTLIKQADVAMYRAKRGGADWVVFDNDTPDPEADRLHMIAALRAAIESGQLDVAYQPIIETATRRVVSFEALARWSDPERGAIPPDRFITLAEQSDLIVPLTRIVLRKAAADCASWRAAGHDVRVAVNLSVQVIDRCDVVMLATEELAQAGLAPQHLMLEITESALAADVDHLLSAVAGLQRLGVTIAIDDFGTGFSAMSYLKRLPVAELKIDRSFVRDIASEARDVEIVRSLVRLAHSLSLRVVAEGVESVPALEVLTALGCDFAQGYGIARPMSATDVRPWLAARNEPQIDDGPETVALGPRHLLVVDDSRVTRLHLCALATRQGWEVREAASAEEALIAVECAHPDVIILDHHMTGVSMSFRSSARRASRVRSCCSPSSSPTRCRARACRSTSGRSPSSIPKRSSRCSTPTGRQRSRARADRNVWRSGDQPGPGLDGERAAPYFSRAAPAPASAA